jgi:hypothetical protein
MILGVLGILLGAAALLISVLFPILTDGRSSWDEALLGIIPSAVVLGGSFFVFAVGLIAMLVQRKNRGGLVKGADSLP